MRRARGPAAVLLALASGACDAPDSGTLYVTSGFTDEILILQASDGELVRRIPVDRRRDEVDEPHGVAVAPDGRHWYATVSHGEPTLWKFERAGDRLVGRVSLETPGAARIGITPDGRRAFIPDYFRTGQGVTSRVAVVELETLDVVARPEVCAAPHDAQVSPDGRNVAVACSLGDEVVVLDALDLSVTRRLVVGPAPGHPGEPAYRPMNLVWDGVWDGRGGLWVTLHHSSEVVRIGAEGATTRVSVGEGPGQLAWTHDGGTLVVANRSGGSVSLVDAREGRERARIRLGVAHPHGVAVSPAGIAYVTYEGDVGEGGGVVALGVAEGEVLWRVPAGVFTLGVAWAPPSRSDR